MKFITSLRRNTVVLIIVTVLAIQTLVIVNYWLKPHIDQAAENYLKQTIAGLDQALPTSSYNNDLGQACYTPKEGAFGPDPIIEKLLIPRENGKTVAYILIGSTMHGYNGLIRTMLVTNPQGTIKAVRVLEQLETPGLGNKVVTTNWVHEFDDIKLADAVLPKFAVKKDNGDIDQFTGATITPRAIVNQIRANMQEVIKKLVEHPQQALTQDFIHSCKVKEKE